MGIQGLLPQLKSIMVPIHVQELRGQTVAVDTYSWLHKGAHSCSAHLCKGLPTTKHINYCMHRVNLLRHHGIKPILVFDGGFLPMKIDQETKRSRVRKENLERALEHEESGNSAAAFECYQKAVDISPSVAYGLIQVLKQEKVDYIVAPYEADAQMTFLYVNKHVDAVITEDSDLIPFGCSRIIFKMDKFGQGVEFQSSKLGENKELDFTGFTKQMLLEMCIFSGCDYLQSLPGMGLKRAHALVQKLKNHEKVIKHLRYSAVSVPQLYEEAFKRAMWAFQHQRVYDHTKEDIVHLSDIPHGIGHELDFLGPWLPQGVVKGIAKGDLDPFTKLPFQGKETCTELILGRTYSAKESAPENGRKRLDLPVQKNVMTNYFCLASLEAKRKFRAPKVIRNQLVAMYSSSPSSESHESESPASAEAATCTINQPEGPLPDSESPKDELPSEDSMGSTFSNSSRPRRLPLNGNFNNSELPCILLETKHEPLKPFLTSHKEYDCNSAHKLETNNKLVNRKVVIRSSYFQNKLMDENESEDQNIEPILNKDACTIFSDLVVPKGAGDSCHKNGIKKIKLSHIQAVQLEKPSLRMQETSVVEEGCGDIAALSDKAAEVGDVNGGFGCGISHLKNYSSIAEKSMERFVSTLSSFRYTSSKGSRASGLRAPLKDVQNTMSMRPTLDPNNLFKYRYVPDNKRSL